MRSHAIIIIFLNQQMALSRFDDFSVPELLRCGKKRFVIRTFPGIFYCHLDEDLELNGYGTFKESYVEFKDSEQDVVNDIKLLNLNLLQMRQIILIILYIQTK